MPRTRDVTGPLLDTLKNAISNSPRHVFSRTDLSTFIREQLDLLGSVVVPDHVVEALLARSDVIQIVLKSPDYAPISRIVVGSPSPFEIGLSLKKGSYLSHASAIFLQGLNDQLPKTIYVNKEQSPKPRPTTALSQERITRAFQSSARRTNYVFRHEDIRYALLSGKSTGDFGVETITGPQGEALRVTNLERTLVDVAVRPVYAGGVFQVLEAYRASVERLSVPALITTLARLDHMYPYHQVVGYYLEKAGLTPEQTEPLRTLGLNWDFYLTHGLRDSDYVASWRLFVPRGF